MTRSGTTLKQSLDTVITALAGPMSGRFDLHPADKPQGRLSYRYDLSYTLAPGTDGKALLDAYEKLVGRPLDEAAVRPGGQRHEAEAVGQPPEGQARRHRGAPDVPGPALAAPRAEGQGHRPAVPGRTTRWRPGRRWRATAC